MVIFVFNPFILHKTDIGGVRVLNLTGKADPAVFLANAAEEMIANLESLKEPRWKAGISPVV